MKRVPMLVLVVAVAGCGSSQATPRKADPPVSSSARPPSAAPSAQSPACAEDVAPYTPRPASSVEVQLPQVPTLEKKPIKIAGAYTVWGASYHLRSHVHRKDVKGKRIVVEGYIVKTNLPDAPRCAVHRTGRANPENCSAPVPAFWIADTRDDPPSASIKVLGWASNYAQIYAAIQAFDSGNPDYVDEFWGVGLPNPLPAVGARVRVEGVYSTTFGLSTSAPEANFYMGLVTYEELSTTERAPELATLPGVRRAKPPTAPPR